MSSSRGDAVVSHSGRCLAAMILAALLALSAAPAFSQTITTGDIAGVIHDTTGAVVPNAAVNLRSSATNENRTTVTNDAGQYRFSLLAPGDYTLSAQTSGMKSNAQKLTVLVGQVLEMNLTLNVEGTKEVIEVQAEAAVLQTENANLATGYTTQQVVDLPMAGGDLTTLAMTVPGIRVNAQGGGSGNINANGVPGSSVLFTLNGADEMDPYNNLNNSGASNNLLGANEVAEAAVVLNAYSPQYGHLAGGQVNLIGKSGTNAFHGNAFYNYNGEFLNANDFFNNATGTPRGRSDAHQFGASFGGPIKKDKIFIFGDYEALRYVLPAAGAVSLPSPQLEQYALAHAPASALPLYQDMFSLVNAAPGINRAVPVSNGSGLLQDSNNVLGCGTGTFAGTPTGTGGVFGVNTPCALAFGINDTAFNKEGLFTVRGDINITEKQKIYLRYNQDFGLQATGTSPIAPVFSSVSNQPQDTGSLNYTYVITPTLVNNFIGTAFWYSAIFGVADFAKTTSLMPEILTIADGGCNACATTPGGSTAGFVSVGAGFPTGRNVGHAELIDDLAWTRGRHTIKAGVAYRYDRITYTSIASGSIVGTYTFNDLADFANGVVNSTGLGSKFAQAFPLYQAEHFRVPSLGAYVSDEWAVNRNLKLTLGIRLEHDGNPGCVENCFALPNVPFISSSYQGGVNIPYNATIISGKHNEYYSLESVIPQPRFGFVYSPFGNNKTVIRGGVGIFASVFSASTAANFARQGPNLFSPSVTFGNVGLPTDAGTAAQAAQVSAQAFESGFNQGFTLAQIKTALGKIPFALPSISSAPSVFYPPHDTEWSLEIEQQLSQRNVLSLTYAGNHGYDLQETYNRNAYTSAAGVTRYGGGYDGLPTAAPDPRFLTVTQYYNNGYSNYDGATIQLRHAFSYGLTGQINYTWSHALEIVGWYNPFNINTGYGSSPFDNRHRIAADFVWTAPHKFQNKAVSALAGGWTLGGKMYIYSGSPFNVTDSKIPAQINSSVSPGTILADMVNSSVNNISCGKAAISTPCYPRTAFATYASTSGVASPIQTDFGNVAPDSLRGPGYFDLDAQLTRDFRITEHATLTFGLQAYNVLNHPSFFNPSGCVSSASCGLISGPAVYPPTSIYGSFQGAAVSGRVTVLTGKFTF